MSRLNKPPSDDLLQEAVELRIGGYNWQIVAQKVKRTCDTVRKWPVKYPERWEAAIERAERRLSIDSNAESVVVLRNMLRVDDLEMRWKAAKTLVGLRVDLGKLGLRLMAARSAAGQPADPASDRDYQYYRFLPQHSDQELERLVAALHSPMPAPIEHDQSGHARGSTTDHRNAACVAEPAAHDQHDRAPTLQNT
jgi:hypothetical protein